MEYKKLFSEEEINEVVRWFEEHREELPASLQLDKATFIPDLPHTMRLYADIANRHKDKRAFSGQIFLMFKVRELLESMKSSS